MHYYISAHVLISWVGPGTSLLVLFTFHLLLLTSLETVRQQLQAELEKAPKQQDVERSEFIYRNIHTQHGMCTCEVGFVD